MLDAGSGLFPDSPGQGTVVGIALGVGTGEGGGGSARAFPGGKLSGRDPGLATIRSGQVRLSSRTPRQGSRPFSEEEDWPQTNQ